MSRSNGHKPYIPPPPEKLVYQADGLDVTLEIVRANVSTGTYRALLIKQAGEEEAEFKPDGNDLKALGDYLTHTVIFPSILAATVSASGFGHWPITFAEYLSLPEQLVWAWEAKVWELNPHWKPVPAEPEKQSEEDAKKAPSSAPA